MHHQRSSNPTPNSQNWACGPSACTYVLIFLRCDRCFFVFYSLLILFIYIYFKIDISYALYILYNLFTYFSKLLKLSFLVPTFCAICIFSCSLFFYTIYDNTYFLLIYFSKLLKLNFFLQTTLCLTIFLSC